MPPLNLENLSPHESVRDNGPCLCEDPPESLTRDVHPLGRGFLVQSLIVTQPDGLQALNRQKHFLAPPGRYPSWNKGINNRVSLHESQLSGSRHGVLSIGDVLGPHCDFHFFYPGNRQDHLFQLLFKGNLSGPDFRGLYNHLSI
jgi:hypothetical protein